MPEPTLTFADVGGDNRPFSDSLYFSLFSGEGGLILCRNPVNIRTILTWAMADRKPDKGVITWWPEHINGPDHSELKPLYNFYVQIGLITKKSQLLSGLTLLEQISHGLEYGKGLDMDDSEADGLRLLSDFGLQDEADTMTTDLAEPKRRLALYALALSQPRKLLLLERPADFLDQNFKPVWRLIRQKAATEGLAYLVIDQKANQYYDGDFNFTITAAEQYLPPDDLDDAPKINSDDDL